MNTYERLGGDKFLPNEQIQKACNALDEMLQEKEDSIDKALDEYSYEVNNELERLGFKLPDEIVENFKEELLRRKRPEKLDLSDEQR